MKKIYINRLLKFAKHLDKIKHHPEEGLFRQVVVYAFVDKVRIHIDVKTPHFVFEELVSCFKSEWSFNDAGDPVWDEMESDANTAECVCDFFGISNYELFCHLWDIGYQTVDTWGGKKLTEENCSGPDIAHNIFEYIETKKRAS